MASLPTVMRAIIQVAPGQASVQEVPVPQANYGFVLVKIEVALVHSNLRNVFNAVLPHFKLPYPLIPGSHAVGRVVRGGPDTTVLKEGQIVFVNSFVRARDDPSISVVWGITPGFSPEANRVYTSLVPNGVFAEYVLAPLENTYALDEARLLGDPAAGGLGYSAPDILHFAASTIMYGGLRNINLKAGERVIVTPATGIFSASAVDVAVAMGATVIAASRNADGLATLKKTHPRIETVQLAGDLETDAKALAAFGPVDAVIDVSPPAATGANNLEAAVAALRPHGRVSLMGGRQDKTLPVSYMAMMTKSITIRGLLMYSREDQWATIRLAEAGLLRLGKAGGHEVVATYGLDDLSEALDKASQSSGPGQMVCLKP